MKPHVTTASIYPPRLVVVVLKSLHEQTVLVGGMSKNETAFAGPVPDQGDTREQFQGTCCVDDEGISPD